MTPLVASSPDASITIVPMAQRRFHYDLAFEDYLRQRTIPYVAVDEAKRALGAGGAGGCFTERFAVKNFEHNSSVAVSLKNFDFIVYSQSGPNLLVDVKGRKHASRSNRSLQNWVTQADVRCMGRWESVFGGEFEAVFAFLYWCQQPPPDALFQDIFEAGGRWYAAMGIKLASYRFHAKQRSRSWGTVCMPSAEFNRQAVPLRQLL